MMQIRKDPLESGQYYHIFSRSIAKFVVFNDATEFSRMIDLFSLFRFANFDYQYSKFFRLTRKERDAISATFDAEAQKLVDIVAYCLMPTHFHLILRQINDGGISRYVSRSLNGYTRYFNTKHRRTGPLWSGRFKSVLVDDNDQLLHLSRYLHLNPTSAGLVKKPEDWQYSSYREYIKGEDVCKFREIVDLTPKMYQKFTNDQKEYQQKLALIKNLLIDNYAG